MNKGFLISLLVLILIILLMVWLYQWSLPRSPKIINFQECVAAGNPIIDSWPRQCRVGDQILTEEMKRVSVVLKETALIDNEISLTFKSLIEDSRCPVGAQCVWAGRARIELTIKKDDNEETQEIFLGDKIELETLGGKKLVIVFSELLPEPILNPPSDYQQVAVFWLVR